MKDSVCASNERRIGNLFTKKAVHAIWGFAQE
jgi:hypothetical protein